MFQQDKDLLGDGNLYGKDTCCFISPELNSLLRVFETEVKGVRATSQGTYQYVYNGRTYGVPTKEEAVYYAYKRDKEKLLNYTHDNFEILCESVINGILNKIDEIKGREFTQEKEQLKAKAEYDEYARFVKDYSAFKTEKPNRDGLPDGIVFKRSLKGGYIVRINFRGRSMLKNHRAHFDTLSEAELFLLEKKLEVMGIIENDYFFNKRVVENMGLNLFLGKIFTKTKILCFLVGCSRYIYMGGTLSCTTYLVESFINLLVCLTAPRSDAEKYGVLPKISIQWCLSARRINLKI